MKQFYTIVTLLCVVFFSDANTEKNKFGFISKTSNPKKVELVPVTKGAKYYSDGIIAPTVDFTSDANSNTCSATAVQFTSTAAGIDPLVYQWDFGDGTTSTAANPSHIFVAEGCATQDFNVTLTVTDDAGESSSVTKIITVKQKPVISFTDVNNSFTPFDNCQNASASAPAYTITVGNTSPSACIASYSIDWGDGSPILNNATFPRAHTYANLGSYFMTITALGSNGCIATRIYVIKNVSNPSGGITSPGTTHNLCAPTAALQFAISGWAMNSPGTTYEMNYGDGTPLVIITQETLLASPYYNAGNPGASGNYPVPHSYVNTSCPGNQLEATLTIRNNCGATTGSVANITILKKPIASFAAPAISCSNTTVLFNNTTIGGYNQNCTQELIFVWNFGDGSPIITTPLQMPQNMTHTFPGAGVYTVSLTAIGFCGQDTYVQNICIEDPITPQVTFDNAEGCSPVDVNTTNTTNLVDMCDVPEYLWTVNYTAGYCGTGTPVWAFTNGTNATSPSPSFRFTTPGTYLLSLVMTNSCGPSLNLTKTIIVKQPPTAIINPIADSCGPATINPSAVIDGCAPASSTLTYAWSFPGGTPSTSSSAVPGTITYNTVGTYTVSLVVTNECGSSAVSTETFEVKLLPELTTTPLSQVICSGSQTALVNLTANDPGATFSWTATGSAGVAGFQASGNGNTIPVQIITTTGSTPGTVTYSITTSLNGCSEPPVNYVVTINPSPFLTSQPVSSTVCQNGTPSVLTFALNSTSGSPIYQWYSNTVNSNTGGTLISGETNTSYNPPATATGTVYYYATIQFSSGDCPNLVTNTAFVTVEPLPIINLQPIATQNICIGGQLPAALTVSHTGGAGAVSYQWYSNSTNSTSGGTLISGANGASYMPPSFTTIGTYYYYVTVTLSANGCAAVVSNTAEVNVLADPIVTSQPIATQTICQNAAPTNLSVTASGGVGIFSYQWYRNTANNTTTGTLIPGAINATFTPPTDTVGTIYYYCVITQTGAGCSVISNTATVRINLAPFINQQPASSSVCLGGTPTLLSVGYANGVGTPTYQWFSNTTNSTAGATAISGETNNTYNPPSSVAGTTYYFATISFSSGGGCSNLTSNIAEVIIVPETAVTVQPIPTQSFCIGGSLAAPLSVSFTGGLGTATYQWYSNTTNSTTGGTLISGATNSTYMPPALTTAGSYYYYVRISLSGNGCDPAVSNTAEIIVVNDPVVTVQPLPTQTVCENAIPADLSVTASGGVGTYSYQWYSNSINNNTTGTAISGATNSNYTPPTNSVGTMYYYVVINQSGSGCSTKSNTAEVKVNVPPTMTTQPVSSTVCEGGTPTLLSVAYVNGVGTPSYQWFVNTTNTTVGASPITGATGNTFSPPSATAGVFYYFATITFTSASGCGNLTSDIATVTIAPETMITVQPIPTQTFCAGGSVSAPLSVSYTGGTGTATFQWYSNTTNSTTGGTLITGATNSNYTPPAFATAGNYYYYVTISLSGNGCDPAVSDTAEIIVVNDPVVTVQPLPTQTVCENAIPADLSVTASGGVGTYSYQWYSNTINNNSTGTAITGAINSSFTPPTNIVGTMYYYVMIAQTGSGCSTVSNTALVKVNTIPIMTTQPVSSTVCEGGTPTLLSVAYVNGVGTPTYQWFVNTTNTTVGASPITGATGTTFSPPSTTAGVFYYFATITFTSASGCGNLTSDIATVTIAPETTITVQPIPTQTFCAGGSVSAPLSVSYTGGTGTEAFQWYSNTTNSTTGGTLITGATNSSYTPAAFATAGNYYYYVRISLSGNGCDPAVSDIAQVIVVNDPVVTTQPLASQNLCEGMTPANLGVTVSGGIGTYSYQWYSNTVDNTISGTAITGAINSSFTPPTNIIGTLYYYVVITQTGSGCSTVSATAKVIINPIPVITANPASSSVCQGQAANVLSVSYRNGTGTPSYQWYSNTTNSNIGGTPISGATNSSFVAPVNVAGTFYYYSIISFSAANCASLTSAVATVEVKPNPVISAKTRLICSGASFNLAPTNSGGDLVPAGTLYTWTNPIVNPAGSVTGGLGQAVPQPFISQILTNNTNSPATVTYTLTPISGSCIGAPFTLTVTVNPFIDPNVTVVNSTCFGGNNGSIQTNITGGVPFTTGNPYQISWTGPDGFTSAAANISNLAPGTYNLSITESGGCPFTQSYVVSEPSDIAIRTDNEKDISCFDIANGAISITVSGGTAPYTYSWTKDSAPFSTSEDLSNLSPGNYTVTVFDSNTCGPKTASFTITQPLQLEANLLSKTDILCFGGRTGSINVDVVGGTPNYTFSWTGPNAFISSSQNLTALVAGTYNLTVTDRLGCTTPLSVTLTQSIELQISNVTQQISCYGANNGSISLSMTGGVGPYQIQWSNLSTSATIQNLAPGTYRVTVTDANNCQKSQNIVITQPPLFTVNPVLTHVSCQGGNDGSINLNFVGGVAPVTVVWEDSTTSNSIRNNLASGTYNVLITDAQNCQIYRSFIILEPQPLIIAGTVTDAFNCNTINSGSINLVVTGGTTPYRYAWSNGSISQNLNNLPPGNYSVTVTDAKGCSQNKQFSVIRQQALNVTVKTETIADCDIQEVKQKFEAQVTGGVPPYHMTWSSGTVSGANNQFMETSQNGAILLLVTDSVGCTTNYSFNVDVPEFYSEEFDVTSDYFTIHGEFSIQDPIQFFNNSTGNYSSISWTFGDGGSSLEENPIHIYPRAGTYVVTQTIVYPFGCTIVYKMTLEITKGYRLIPPTGFTPNDDGINDNFAPLFSGLESVELSIYDTWGEMIFYEKGETLKGWNGKLKNRDAENGNYYFKVKGTTFYGETVNEHGAFTLIK